MIVLQHLLDPEPEAGEHPRELDALVVEHLHARVALAVLGLDALWLAEDLLERAALRVLRAEVAVERPGPADRVVGGVRDELQQLAADDQRAAPVHVDPAHRAAVLPVEMAGEGVLGLVIVLVGVEQPVVEPGRSGWRDRRHRLSVPILDSTVKFFERQAAPGRGTRPRAWRRRPSSVRRSRSAP